MKVSTLQGVLASAVLSLGFANVGSASIITADLYTPLTATGNVITPLAVNGAIPAGNSNIIGFGYTIDFATDADQGVVSGTTTSVHATPVAGVTGATPEYSTGDYGSSLTTSLSSSGNYLSTGFGTITITFSTPQTSFALLWGSIDTGNSLSFNDSAKDVVTGTQVEAATPGFAGSGFEGPGGSAYVLINTLTPFTTVTATSTVGSFEFLAEAGVFGSVSSSADPVPEPADMVLLGSGLIAIAFLGLRKAPKH